MYAGRVACYPLVSHDEYAEGSRDRQTDRRTDRPTDATKNSHRYFGICAKKFYFKIHFAHIVNKHTQMKNYVHLLITHAGCIADGVR